MTERAASTPPGGPAETGPPGVAAAKTILSVVPRQEVGPDPDQDLALRASRGDAGAFEALLRRHYATMHRLAWRQTGSQEDAEDIVQDVCCGLAGRIASFRGEARFRTWLLGIVVNACHDHHRRRATLGRLKAGLTVLAGLGRGPDGRDLYRRTWLASALGRLDPALRAAVVLVVGEGLTHAEAGAALGIAEATVSWRLHEARKHIGDTFQAGDI